MFPLPDVVFVLLFIFSTYSGPLLGALIVTRATEGGEGVRRLLKRLLIWRVGFQWYLVAVFIMLFCWLAAFSIIYRGLPIRELSSSPMLLLTVFLPKIVEGIFIPSLGEEPGWRGFALPRLQSKYGPVLGTTILGVLHGLWHLPALFTILFGPLPVSEILPFVLTATAGTFIYTWVFNHTQGSLLIAVLVHASSNAASQLMARLVPAEAFLPAPFQWLSMGWLNTIIFTLVAVVLVVITSGKLGFRTAAETKIEAVQ
jgi:membrane protease YdiL (CAAX protease family)